MRKRIGFGVALMVNLLVLLSVPWILSWLTPDSASLENRALTDAPEIGGIVTLETESFTQLEEFVSDRLDARQHAIGLLGAASVVTGRSMTADVFVDADGNLLLSNDFTEACAHEYAVDDVIASWRSWGVAALDQGKSATMMIVPDKAALTSDERLGDRAVAASRCATERRTEFRASIHAADPVTVVDLWSHLEASASGDPVGSGLYFADDSHWTFAAGRLAASALVEAFGVRYDSRETSSQRTLRVTGDIAARLGLDRSLVVDVPETTRAGVATVLDETDVGGRRTVRTYRSEGANLVPGSTLVIHDSAMNFMEPYLAGYFEEVTFVHWHDMGRANVPQRVASSDHVVVELVERNLHLRSATTFAGDGFADAFGVGDPTDPMDLFEELTIAGTALRRFEADTGLTPEAFSDLLDDRGIPGWSGPYLEGDTFTSATHPSFGEWRVIQSVDRRREGGLYRCDRPTADCGSWVLLLGVPTDLIRSLDVMVDDADGLNDGSVRLSSKYGILYFWPDAEA